MPHRSTPPSIVGVIVFSCIAVAVAIITIWAFRKERVRRGALLESLRAGGFEILHSREAKNPDAARRGFERVGSMRDLRQGAKRTRLYARQQMDGREVTVLEHAYVISTGKSSHTVYHSVVAVPCPASWPALRLTPENFFHKIADLFGRKDIRLEDEAFNARWRVKGKDPEFAMVLLSPQIQQALTAWPREVWLVVGGGALCVVVRAPLTAERLPVLIRLLTELVGMIPPEMEMWGATGSAAPEAR